MKKEWKTPEGQYYTLYKDMLSQPHLLIAGATGSGKSVVINGLLYTALYDSPAAVQLILIDPKRLELIDFKPLPHTLKYASEPGDMVQALEMGLQMMENRFRNMASRHIKEWDGGHIYIIIDELADLMLTNRKQVQPLLQRLAQLGRAARVHVIAATQCPLAKVIPTEIKANFDSRLGLRTASPQDSRNILGVKGCEWLPDPRAAHKAQGYYKHGCVCELWNMPIYDPSEVSKMVNYWTHTRPRIKLF